MPTIDTLVSDIENVLVNGISKDVDPKVIEKFGQQLGQTIATRLIREPREPTLRMSSIGKPCERQLWYEINEPNKGEPLRAETFMKFLYGDILEDLLLFLAEVSGHEVTGRQDESEIEGIKGHKDAIIDGTLVDVKSASSYSFKKFKEGKLSEDDPFGYVDQIQSYLEASQSDPLLQDKSRAGFLVVDKTLGHIVLDIHDKIEKDYRETYKRKKQVVAQETPPERAFEAQPFGKSGNEKLGVNCSYCAFNKTCWPETRTFLYSTGPVTFTKVVREPEVPELKG